MAIPADARGLGVSPARPDQVECASCGARFRDANAEPGARIRCPMCREVVEVARLIAERRRVATAAGSPRIDMGVAKPSRRRARTVVFRLVVIGFLLAAAAVRVFWWREITALLSG